MGSVGFISRNSCAKEARLPLTQIVLQLVVEVSDACGCVICSCSLLYSPLEYRADRFDTNNVPIRLLVCACFSGARSRSTWGRLRHENRHVSV